MLAETETTPPTASSVADVGAGPNPTDVAHRAINAADERPWRAKVAAWARLRELARAHYQADDEDKGEEVDRLADAAFEEILNSRAPTLASMADKGRLVINELMALSSDPAADADNPAYLSHAMNDGWIEHALISLFQDAAALASPTPLPIADARLEAFSASDWLVSTALTMGARFSWVQTSDATPDHLSFAGPGGADAQAAFEALPSWHRDKVRAHLQRQASSFARETERSEWVGPSCTAHMIRVFAEMAAYNAEPIDGAKRAVMRRNLRENMRRDVGLPVGVPDFDPATFTAEAYALGARFKMVNPLFGPELLKKNGDERPETKSIAERFCALDGAQVDALGTYLQKRMVWAQKWIADLERETECVVSYHVSGIGFGIGPDHTGRLAEASAAFGTLSDRERADLKAFCQSVAQADNSALSKAMAK